MPAIRIMLLITLLTMGPGLAAAAEATSATRGAKRVEAFRVDLPDSAQEFPRALPAGREPGFKFRGTKGWLWKPNQYMSEIPVIARCRMNFLMNCYGSMCDIENHNWGDPQINRWWEDLPEAKKTAYEDVVRACQKQGLIFCFGMNPNICTKRVMRYDSAEDTDALYKHYKWMQGLGVKWFNISLDDITEGINASGQAKAVNEIFARLRAADPEAQMIFCPTYYWGDGTEEKQKPYLEILARELHKDVYVFWTGDAVVGPITRKGADTFRGIVKHRVFLWDNYPVNDGRPTMHLGPVIDRDPALGEVVDGYMCNPLHTQTYANRIPMLTCADYAWNPADYDPARSIGQAIMHLESTPDGRNLWKDLVEIYPGMLICRRPDTGFNAARDLAAKLMEMPHGKPAAAAFIGHLEKTAAQLDRLHPNDCQPEKTTLRNDIENVRQAYKTRYGQ